MSDAAPAEQHSPEQRPVEPSSVEPSSPEQHETTIGKVLSSGPVRAAALVALLGLCAEWIPGVEKARFFSAVKTTESMGPLTADAPADLTEGEAELTAESRSLPGMQTPSSAKITDHRGPIGGREAPLDLPALTAEASPVDITDPADRALDDFFSALEKTQRKEAAAITRIAYFGDSIVVSDYISGTLRRKLQETFGDAGHGYMLIANPWPAYFHNDVFRFATKGFSVSRIVGPLTKDGMYGLGGVTFRSSGGIIAQFGTAEEGEYGRNVSHFELSYLARPTGGSFEIWVDGRLNQEVSTQAPKDEVRRVTLEVPDGEHRFEMRTRRGEVRSFGVVLERRIPGVVLDALGVQGARIRFLDKQDDAHFADELKWRNPNLIVYHFGANESGDGYAYPMDEYKKTMKAVIAQGQAALPDSSCLIIGAMDRARHMDGVTSSMKIIQLIIEQQELAARELGCAYFDTYEAMGGWGSMPSWVRRGLGQADMTHPTGVGAIRIGNWIYGALMKRYAQYLQTKQAP